MSELCKYGPVALTLTVALAGCQSEAPSNSDDGISSFGGDDSPAEDTFGDEGFDDGFDDDGGLLDLPHGDEGTDNEPDECASISADAEAQKLPADIIVVVDNSGSMGDEAAQIQAKLNGFSQQIVDSGVDVRVMLISSYPGNGYGICIDPPLGGGGCPGADNNPPLFTHVNAIVGSHNAFQRVLEFAGEWGAWTRPEATTHVLVVTDDESNMSANAFYEAFVALRADYEDLKVHGVVAMHNCSYAASIGNNYINLANDTGGVVGDLCNQDFDPVFNTLSTEVIAGSLLPCSFDIPPPPEGETFDPDQVNVEYHVGSQVTPIGRVESPAECPLVESGWYYDDPVNPTSIVMCEQTCQAFEDAGEASLEILFGCETQPAG